ncbi:hypothetical protein D3C87_1644230 [compost metagenome]
MLEGRFATGHFHRIANTVGQREGDLSSGDVELRHPAEIVLGSYRDHLFVELLAGDIGILDHQSGPAGHGKPRHDKIDGDDHPEEGEHDHQHMPAGKFTGLKFHFEPPGAWNVAV